MNLYYITATDPNSYAENYDQMVVAETPERAVQIWQGYYEFGPGGSTEMFPGSFIPSEHHPKHRDYAIVWQIHFDPKTVEGVLEWITGPKMGSN